VLIHREKPKKGGFPECLGRGTWGSFFFKKDPFSPECLEGALREEVFKKQLSSLSVALGEEDFFKKTNFFSGCCTRGRGFF
jgi:hypothetical protein